MIDFVNSDCMPLGRSTVTTCHWAVPIHAIRVLVTLTTVCPVVTSFIFVLTRRSCSTGSTGHCTVEVHVVRVLLTLTYSSPIFTVPVFIFAPRSKILTLIARDWTIFQHVAWILITFTYFSPVSTISAH